MNISEVFDQIREITESNAYHKFLNAANNLFSNFCIRRGTDTFFFLEIEFYYHSPEHQDNNKETGESFVYPRQCKEDGQFFLHASGVDICMKNGEDSWGGILIRSLLLRKPDGKEFVVTGPWDCYSTLFSYTSGDVFPKLVSFEGVAQRNTDIESCRRNNADKSVFSDCPYAFFDKNYVNGNRFISNLERYDYTKDAGGKPTYNPNFDNRK